MPEHHFPFSFPSRTFPAIVKLRLKAWFQASPRTCLVSLPPTASYKGIPFQAETKKRLKLQRQTATFDCLLTSMI